MALSSAGKVNAEWFSGIKNDIALSNISLFSGWLRQRLINKLLNDECCQ
jgi:hypothetical protein